MAKKEAFGRTHVMSAPPVALGRGNVSGSLTVLSGSATGTVFSLPANEFFIGRSPEAKLQLDDDGVSRCHARISPWHGSYLLEDLGSTNGTYIDGQRIDQPVVLNERMRIQFGGTLLQFDLQDRLQQEAAQRMYEMAVRDGLTGLYNRRHFNERLAAEFAFAVRHHTPLGVIMVDVDHFKRINDRYGHPAGDAVLQEVGRTLQTAVRVEDIVSRFGGEEFAVLVRGIAPAGVRALAERLRVLLCELSVTVPSGALRVTASFGVSHNTFAASRAEQLVAAADAALYEAKRLGRNRVEGPTPVGQYALQGDQRRHVQARHQITRPKDQ